MLSTLSASALGLLMLALFGLFNFLGIFATARAILAFVGTCLIGTAGFAGGTITQIAKWAADLANHATSWAFGVGGGIAVLTIATPRDPRVGRAA